MKKQFLYAALFAILLTTSSFATNGTETESKANPDLIVKNLIEGVKSDNLGLRTSATLQLGNYKSEKAIINLMRVLKDDKNEAARISAALSLYKIGNPRGIYSVKRAAKFDDSERVRKLCSKIYAQHLLDEQNN